MRIDVTFPAKKRVVAQVGAFAIDTDQPLHLGGTAAAPSPYDLFLASLATCAGIYALGFCQARRIDTAGLGVSLEATIDPASDIASAFDVRITLPPDFPVQYRAAIVRAVSLCKVEKTIAAQPAFRVEIASGIPEPEPATPNTAERS
jgi:putative redox protein